MQAIILAAGMGKRLKDLTTDVPKCMVKVNGVTLIERMLNHLDSFNLSRIVIVVGYKSNKVKNFINELNNSEKKIKTPIVFVENDIYHKTNNIYSLYLARDYLVQEDTILLESDIIFEKKALTQLIDNEYPSLALVSKYESWMDGTVVRLNNDCKIINFIDKKHFEFDKINSYYKTVNIYKFSKKFSTHHYVPFLEAYCMALGNNEYYEQVLKVITLLDNPGIKALVLDKTCSWYEIDDIQDLDIAESIFDCDKKNKFKRIQKRYGGFWRYPRIIDFCYLVNPYFPPKKLLDEIQANFHTLITQYPSSLEVNNLLASKNFGVRSDQIIIGNGAAELINIIMGHLEGNIGIVFPTFEEYPNRVEKDRIVSFTPNNEDFRYTGDDLISYFHDKDIRALLLINPDNPSGNFICYKDVLKLIEWAKSKNLKVIVDESFVDFAQENLTFTLINKELLIKYPNLVVIKSLSKAYGIPGLRLGVVASNNRELMEFIKKHIAIWNINSFGEYYMQIEEKYSDCYQLALTRFRKTRDIFIKELSQIPNIKVLESQANYVMCELINISSSNLAIDLFHNHYILIKDLSTKLGMNNKNYIRLAIRNEEDNKVLLEALKKELGK